MKNLGNVSEKLSDLFKQAKRYLPALFCLLLVGIYGFLVYRVSVLNSTEPSSSDVATQSRTAQVPRIDPAVVSQLKSLQDNSVSVQSLFVEARNNPFQE